MIQVDDTQYGASVGIIDYSRKERDTFGNMDAMERTYSKRCSAYAQEWSLLVEAGTVTVIFNVEKL